MCATQLELVRNPLDQQTKQGVARCVAALVYHRGWLFTAASGPLAIQAQFVQPAIGSCTLVASLLSCFTVARMRSWRLRAGSACETEAVEASEHGVER